MPVPEDSSLWAEASDSAKMAALVSDFVKIGLATSAAEYATPRELAAVLSALSCTADPPRNLRVDVSVVAVCTSPMLASARHNGMSDK